MKSIQILISFFLVANLNFSAKGQLFFNSSDTIEVLAPNYDQLTIKHYPTDNQSLEEICEHYGIRPIDLSEYNDNILEIKLDSTTALNIPIPKSAIRKISPEKEAEHLYHPLIYKVKAGENLFHVSKRLFNQSMDSIQVRNKLDILSLNEGQLIHVGWLAKFGIPKELQTKRLSIQIKQNQINHDLFLHQTEPKNALKQEQGSAVKMSQNKSKDLVCLHKDSKRGTILKVENPMNNRVLYLEVIGTIPPHFEPKTKLVTPEYVAKLLGVIDDSFYITIEY